MHVTMMLLHLPVLDVVPSVRRVRLGALEPRCVFDDSVFPARGLDAEAFIGSLVAGCQYPKARFE